MKIVLDLQSLQSGSRSRGIGRYSLALARAMIAEGKKHDFFIMLNHAFPETIEEIKQLFSDLLPPKKIMLFRTPAVAYGLESGDIRRYQAAEMIREYFLENLQPDWVHISSLFECAWNNTRVSIGCFAHVPTAVTLYDLIPYQQQELFLVNSVMKSQYMRQINYLFQAKLLLAISKHIQKEAINMLGLPAEQVINISTDADSCFQINELDEDAIRVLVARYTLKRDFIMYTGSVEPRKNVDRLLGAFANLPIEVRKKHQLIICYKVTDEDRQRLTNLASRLGLAEDEIVLTGYVNDEDLVALYNLCKLFVFPSLSEGFGLPVLEAMRCGAPVIGSNCTSIPEVIGFKEALFDPTSITSMCDKMYQSLTDGQFRQQLRENGKIQSSKFSWKNSARCALEAMEAIHERQQYPRYVSLQINSSQDKPRLAYISPLPPEKSRIAGYSAELLPELTKYYDIDLVTDLSKLADPWLETNLRRLSVIEFERRAYEYDRILYHFGNSEFCRHMFPLLKKFPGTVVLHDFFLSNILYNIEAKTPGSTEFRQTLFHSHGYPALRLWKEKGAKEAMRIYPCCLEIFQEAQGVIVLSEQALNLAEQFFSLKEGLYLTKIPQLPDLSLEVTKDNVKTNIDMPQIVRQYVEAIEFFFRNNPVAVRHRLLLAIASLPEKPLPDTRELAEMAEAIAENTSPYGIMHQFLVDISILVHEDAKTGIQRVTRNILQQLMAEVPAGYRVEPIYRVAGFYRYARHFTASFLSIDEFGVEDAPVEIKPGDIFLGLDLDADTDQSARDWQHYQAQRGLKVYFVVYDLLPLLMPDYFRPNLPPLFKAWLEGITHVADGLVSISQSTAIDIGKLLSLYPVERARPLQIDYFHLGADIESDLPSNGISAEEKAFLDNLANQISFLMVGTIEPRKGHVQALEAFEALWGKNEDVFLVIAGKQGWKTENLVKRLRSHPELGKRLFWLENASDEMLLRLYQTVSVLLMASIGEGFGLPLIEAARHKLPIIARDLPVFKEVAGDHAFYFNGKEGQDLAEALKSWLDLYRQGEHPRSDGMPWLTWEESARQLKQVIFGSQWRGSWDPKNGFLWNDEVRKSVVLPDKIETKD